MKDPQSIIFDCQVCNYQFAKYESWWYLELTRLRGFKVKEPMPPKVCPLCGAVVNEID